MLKRLAALWIILAFVLSTVMSPGAVHAAPPKASVEAAVHHDCQEMAGDMQAAPKKAPASPIKNDCCKNGACACPVAHGQAMPAPDAPRLAATGFTGGLPGLAPGDPDPNSRPAEGPRRPPRA